jgi:hypothetical protein
MSMRRLLLALLPVVILLVVGSAVLWHLTLKSSREIKSSSNLDRIGLALELYRDKYGTYPPAYIADDHGKPKHSWRVLILPFLDYDDVYRRYDFSQSWDSPVNRPLAADMPREFQSPFSSGHNNTTPYVAITGDGTAWPGATPTKPSQITGQPANTVLVIEAANSDVNWMEPRDIPLSQAVEGIHYNGDSGIRSYRPDHIIVLTGSGVAKLPVGVSTDLLTSAFMVVGGGTADRCDGDLVHNLAARFPRK